MAGSSGILAILMKTITFKKLPFSLTHKLFQVEAVSFGKAGDKGERDVLGKRFAFLPPFGQLVGLFGNLSIFPYYKMTSETELNLYL